MVKVTTRIRQSPWSLPAASVDAAARIGREFGRQPARPLRAVVERGAAGGGRGRRRRAAGRARALDARAAAPGRASAGYCAWTGASGGRTRVRVGLLDEIGIDQDLVLERAGQRRIGAVGDQLVVDRGEIVVAAAAAGGEREQAGEGGGAEQKRRVWAWIVLSSAPYARSGGQWVSGYG